MSILDILALPSPGLARGFLKQLRFFSLQKPNFFGGGGILKNLKFEILKSIFGKTDYLTNDLGKI